jgi:hypothetical protein
MKYEIRQIDNKFLILEDSEPISVFETLRLAQAELRTLNANK